MKRLLIAILILSGIQNKHYEKFFEIEGGPEYMYYFSKFYVGSPEVEQSAIIDTGSDQLAFPCDSCRSSDCGTHQDPRFFTSKSSTFKYDLHCDNRIYYHNSNVCQFIKSYAEGSSILGFLAQDYMKFKNSRPVEDPKLNTFNQNLKKDIKIKAEFGCTTKETGLFKTQYADGILGLDNDSSFIQSMEQSTSQKGKKVFSFGLCLHSKGGIMSVDLRHKFKKDDKITMMATDVKNLSKPIEFLYNSEESYYEITVNHFKVGTEHVAVPKIMMMVDSGTTFSHFPSSYLDRILNALNKYCQSHTHSCGRIDNAVFEEDTCLELKQPDDHYRSVGALLDSFPNIEIYIDGYDEPYILYPKNYFYEEYMENQKTDVSRICMALKGEEEGKIILGAFSMIDYYFYFDRKSKSLKIFKEDCYLRTKSLLMKKERILEAVFSSFEKVNFQNFQIPNYSPLFVKICGFFTLIVFCYLLFKIVSFKFRTTKISHKEESIKPQHQTQLNQTF
jgi:hypothetical protein